MMDSSKATTQSTDKKNKFKRKTFKSRKQKRLEQAARKDDRDTNPRQNTYAIIVKKNEDFEFFYKKQNIVDSEEEWAEFLAILSQPLPVTFRISSHCRGQAQKMRDIIQSDYIKNCIGENGDQGDDLKTNKLNIFPIPWYPNRLAWTINLSKTEIRKSPALTKLHEFLISETETGDISRQEAVSMIPPLLLDIKAGLTVLDMCAAPGSKTAQIIEMLHQESNSTFVTDTDAGGDEQKILDGLVVANDIDNRRCYMLVHQSKRLHSPCVVITNHDAVYMPDFYQTDDQNVRSRLKFDRVLADVPCTGDGTFRKNYDVWTKWNAGAANNIHSVQLRIAKRGVELLAKDGIIAYSTCSLNPVEDEAVVATILNQAEGGLELIDAVPILPELKCRRGFENWTVISRDNMVYSSFSDVPEKLRTQIRETLFPPANAAALNLSYCIRIMPHYQNTGGFFIALIRKKVDKMCWEQNNNEDQSAAVTSGETSQNSKVPPKRKRFMCHREDPFYFLDDQDDDWASLKSYYRFPDHLPANQLAHRCSKGKRRNIYYLTKRAADFIRSNQHIKLITAGARVFNRIDVNNLKCPYRVTQEGIPSMFPYFMPRLANYSPPLADGNDHDHADRIDQFNIIEFDFEHFIQLLKLEDLKTEQLTESIRKTMARLSHGCCVLYVKLEVDENGNRAGPSRFILPICAWKGKNSIRAYVAKNDRAHYLRLCGHEPPPQTPKGSQGNNHKRNLDDESELTDNGRQPDENHHQVEEEEEQSTEEEKNLKKMKTH